MATNIKEFAEGRGETFHVDPRKLKIKEGLNCRLINFDASDELDLALAVSISNVGVEVPLRIFRDGEEFYIADGHRRHSATMHAINFLGADIKTVPTIMMRKGSNESDLLLLQITSSETSKKPSNIEIGETIKKLQALGWQAKDIAAKAGLSPARISQLLHLQEMPEPVKQMVHTGVISANVAAATFKANGENGEATVEKLNTAVAAAKAEGRETVLPRHVEDVQRSNFKTVIGEAFEKSEIDYDSSDTHCMIAMPHDLWETVRDMLKL